MTNSLNRGRFICLISLSLMSPTLDANFLQSADVIPFGFTLAMGIGSGETVGISGRFLRVPTLVCLLLSSSGGIVCLGGFGLCAGLFGFVIVVGLFGFG